MNDGSNEISGILKIYFFFWNGAKKHSKFFFFFLSSTPGKIAVHKKSQRDLYLVVYEK